MSAPRYVQYGSLMTPPAPFESLRTTLHGFVAQADGELLDALCRRVFDEPTGRQVTVQALGDRVMLTWGQIDQVRSTTPPYDGYGGLCEPQVVVWVPTAVTRRDGAGDVVARRFAMFVPYIWVDNAMSLATGRELFGYPKGWGWIAMPQAGDPAPRRWTLDAFGPAHYDPDAIAGRHPLLEIVEGDALEGDGEDPWHEGLVDLARDVAAQLADGLGPGDMLRGLGLAKGLAGDLIDRRLPHVFLKQVRDIDGSEHAALQQVTECTYEVTRVAGRPRLREYTLTVHRLDGHPVVTELGLESQSLNLAYEIELDFLVGEGRVLWPG